MSQLSTRELQVLELTAFECLSAKEVADELNISPTTVQNHIKNIKEKLSLQKVSELCKHYYLNIYLCLMMLMFAPSIFEDDFARRARSRARARTSQSVIARRSEFELLN